MTRLEKIKDELEFLESDKLLAIYREYANENHFESVYENTTQNLIEYFDNNLEKYLLDIEGNQYYEKGEKFFSTNGYGYIKSFDSIEEVVDLEELARFVEENWYKYDFYCYIDIDFEEEEEEDK